MPFITKLINSQSVVDNTYVWEFEKPAGFDFAAGQYTNLTLINPTQDDPVANCRFFSMASAPAEKTLLFAARSTESAFNAGFRALRPGEMVELSRPAGNFVIEHGPQTIVFFVGGIGIAPVRGILKQLEFEGRDIDIKIFYSNTSLNRALWQADIENWYSHVELITLISDDGQRLSDDIISQQAGQADMYYTVGKPEFVRYTLRSMQGVGIPLERVRMEQFTPY
ncbi:MAG: FAD-dependent oxidoreductase [Candidatus Komeilibacteria bacterium]|nr:FAD-dependent oxidoreductase [Candidatus Komeilibacteria bacterium]